jgi:hypothetical protein
MSRARLRIFYLTFTAAMLVGASAFFQEGDSLAAAHRATKPIRRTASAPATTPSPSESTPVAGATPSDGALTTRRSRGRRAGDTPSAARASDPSSERAQPKTTTEPRSTAKASMPDPTRVPSPTSQGAEARPSAAKAPAEVASGAKSTAEKFAAEPVTDEPESPRTRGAESPRSPERELVPPPAVGTRPVVVTLEGPIFDGGDVPRAAAALERMKPSFLRCASTETALTKNEASLDLRFLVRAPGRAEGVDAGAVRGLSVDVVRCMTAALARSYVGAPSDDPVGVAVTVRIKRPEAANN